MSARTGLASLSPTVGGLGLARSYREPVSYKWAQHLAERNHARWIWDDARQMTYTFYPVAGTFGYLFVEDARSVLVLGPEDPHMWDALR